MPTYDYVCEKCGHAFELFQSMNDKPIRSCPKELCAQKRWGKGTVKRQMGSGAGLIFKGSGFYITDYRSANYKEAAKKDASASSASSTSTPAATPAPAAPPASAPATKPASKSKSDSGKK